MIYYEGVVLSDSQVIVTYDALLYAWGCPNFAHPLIVNGLINPITANLSDALRALRNPQQVYYIWIDAVCINQHDDEEKSVQVRRMIAIFRKARVSSRGWDLRKNVVTLPWTTCGIQRTSTSIETNACVDYAESAKAYKNSTRGHGCGELGSGKRSSLPETYRSVAGRLLCLGLHP